VATESYFDKPIFFLMRKATRYVALYGIRTTLTKVRAQFHMRAKVTFDGMGWDNPALRQSEHPDRFVGIIGCGTFAYAIVADHLSRKAPHFLRGVYDVESARAKSLCARYGGAYAANDPDTLINDPKIRLVYIASNHASHAEYAIKALRAGKHVHIEKPHVVTEDQLNRLNAAHRETGGMMFLGFNRPRSEHFRRIAKSLNAQSGPLMINWFIAGHEIAPGHWYFDEAEGGRVLGNLCHWTDLTLRLVGPERAFPVDVVPVTAPGATSDFCVGFRFGDGSVGAITFSAKGHTFEGVREVLKVHRGDALVEMHDFKSSVVEVVEKKRRYVSLYRDHGHSANVLNSFEAARNGDESQSTSVEYSNATARLFLATREALESGVIISLHPEAELDIVAT
jgi:predicted dehydrogenase